MAMTAKVDLRAMLRKFGVVTVMDVKAYKAVRYDADDTEGKYSKGEWDSKTTLGVDAPLFELDSLKISNINSEGPTKSITGGQNADILLKYGKTFTIEMQEALGSYGVLDAVYGVNFSKNGQIAAVTDRFPEELTLVGTTFVIDQKTGAKQPIHIVIPCYLGDGVFNLAQDADGDASVFDLNGTLAKFNGIEFSGDAVASGTTTETEGAVMGKIYGKGADNEFYFFCTDEALAELKEADYSTVYAEENE